MASNNIVFGIRPVVEAIESGKQIEKIFIRRGAEGQLMSDLRDLCFRHRLRVQEVPVEKLNRLVRGSHQGVVAQIAEIEYVEVQDILERNGEGLNLTYEVRMGILGHTTGARKPETLEGRIVRRADQIAYVNHDIDDAIRAGILTDEDIPRSIARILGQTHSDRIDTLVCDLIHTSREAGEILLSPKVDEALRDLRSFMFERVYRNPVAKGEESKARDMLQRLYTYYHDRPEALPADFQPQLSFDGMERTICDYIAGMTDKYAVDKYTELFIPTGWHVRG